jgi:pre-mRNA-splicing factor RBM22/SLT11
MVPHRAIAFVTYTTREGAEKAAEQLADKLVIKGPRLKLRWSWQKDAVCVGQPESPNLNDTKRKKEGSMELSRIN